MGYVLRCRPTGRCRTRSDTCSTVPSGDRRMRCAGTTPASAIRRRVDLGQFRIVPRISNTDLVVIAFIGRRQKRAFPPPIRNAAAPIPVAPHVLPEHAMVSVSAAVAHELDGWRNAKLDRRPFQRDPRSRLRRHGRERYDAQCHKDRAQFSLQQEGLWGKSRARRGCSSPKLANGRAGSWRSRFELTAPGLCPIDRAYAGGDVASAQTQKQGSLFRHAGLDPRLSG
jgi:hypothetical protein